MNLSVNLQRSDPVNSHIFLPYTLFSRFLSFYPPSKLLLAEINCVEFDILQSLSFREGKIGGKHLTDFCGAHFARHYTLPLFSCMFFFWEVHLNFVNFKAVQK